jgi:hypothetical protein
MALTAEQPGGGSKQRGFGKENLVLSLEECTPGKSGVHSNVESRGWVNAPLWRVRPITPTVESEHSSQLYCADAFSVNIAVTRAME